MIGRAVFFVVLVGLTWQAAVLLSDALQPVVRAWALAVGSQP